MNLSKSKTLFPSEVEYARKFLSVINSSEIFGKLDLVQQLLSIGPIKICREKARTLKTDESVTALAKINESYHAEILCNVRDIYDEEQQSGKIVLDAIEATLVELTALLEQMLQRISSKDSNYSDFDYECFQNSKAVLTFLKLKTYILKSHIAIPIEELVVNTDPFSHCQAFTGIELENAIFKLTKLTTAVESI